LLLLQVLRWHLTMAAAVAAVVAVPPARGQVQAPLLLRQGRQQEQRPAQIQEHLVEVLGQQPLEWPRPSSVDINSNIKQTPKIKGREEVNKMQKKTRERERWKRGKD